MFSKITWGGAFLAATPFDGAHWAVVVAVVFQIIRIIRNGSQLSELEQQLLLLLTTGPARTVDIHALLTSEASLSIAELNHILARLEKLEVVSRDVYATWKISTSLPLGKRLETSES